MCGAGGDALPATSAQLCSPSYAVASQGAVYVSNTQGNTLKAYSLASRALRVSHLALGRRFAAHGGTNPPTKSADVGVLVRIVACCRLWRVMGRPGTWTAPRRSPPSSTPPPAWSCYRGTPTRSSSLTGEQNQPCASEVGTRAFAGRSLTRCACGMACAAALARSASTPRPSRRRRVRLRRQRPRRLPPRRPPRRAPRPCHPSVSAPPSAPLPGLVPGTQGHSFWHQSKRWLASCAPPRRGLGHHAGRHWHGGQPGRLPLARVLPRGRRRLPPRKPRHPGLLRHQQRPDPPG